MGGLIRVFYGPVGEENVNYAEILAIKEDIKMANGIYLSPMIINYEWPIMGGRKTKCSPEGYLLW